MVELTGAIAIALTLAAYLQTKRMNFLKINTLGVFFFGLNLFLKGGLNGAIVSFISCFVYSVAVFTSKKTRENLSFFVPPISFICAYFLIGSEANHLYFPFLLNDYVVSFMPAMGAFWVTLGALQESIIRNKVFLLMGVFLWAFYSLLLGAWFALAADLIGIIALIATLVFPQKITCKSL